MGEPVGLTEGKAPGALKKAKAGEKTPGGVQLVRTENIIEKNLFDPMRGRGEGGRKRGTSSGEAGEIKDLVLIGTVVAGSSRYAILRIPVHSAPRDGQGRHRKRGKARKQRTELRRLTVGDTLEGFELVEIHDRRVVLKKGSSTIEVGLDFSRKVERVKKKAPARKKAARLSGGRRGRRAVGKRPR